MTTCDFSGLDAASCDHCRRGGVPARATVTARIVGAIEARYRGVCRSCGQPYTAGTRITPSDTDGWIAECCAEEDE